MKKIKEITDRDVLNRSLLSFKKAKISARSVLLDYELNIAIIHIRNWNAFSLPGGGVKGGESVRGALKREMIEEAGCVIDILGEIGSVYENRAYGNFVQISHYYLTMVRSEKSNPKMTRSEVKSGSELIWLSPEKAYEVIKNQRPSKNRYSLEFIKRRDLEVFQHLKISNDETAKLFRYIIKIKNI